jgi:hypothetical protein
MKDIEPTQDIKAAGVSRLFTQEEISINEDVQNTQHF